MISTYIVQFLKQDYAEEIILIMTVIVTIVLYYSQKWAERRDAARAIVIQIDIMDRHVDSLARIIGEDVNRFEVEKFWKSADIITENEWDKYRHMFVKKLHYNEIVALSNYYHNIELMAKQQENTKEIVFEIFKYRAKEISDSTQEQQLSVPTLFFITIKEQYEKIVEARATLPYERLKKIARI